MTSLFFAVVLAFTGLPERDKQGKPYLRSESVIVRLADTGDIVLAKNPDFVRPIASVTKLLSGLLLSRFVDETSLAVTIGEEDKDRLKWSRSRLFVGLTAPWDTLVNAALAASENRAMYAAVRMKMERPSFVQLMNDTAQALGMAKSRFVDPAGIDPQNVSTARDLLRLLGAAAEDERLCAWTKVPTMELASKRGSIVLYNPDRLVRDPDWQTIVGKTGYTVEAGRTFVVRAVVSERPVDMVFLGAREMASIFGDAGRVKRWLAQELPVLASAR